MTRSTTARRCLARPVRRAIGVAGSLLLGTLAACESDARPGAGARVWNVGPEPIVLIGVQDGDDAYLFQSIADLALLPDGGAAVADRGFLDVRVYDAGGEHVVRMGREGQGPGEFSYLGALHLVGSDTLLVYDSDQARLTRFLTDGTLVGTTTVHADQARPEMLLGLYSDGDVALAGIRRHERDRTTTTPDSMVATRFGPDGAAVATVAEMLGLRRLESAPLPFTPYLHAFLVGDSILYTDGLDGTLEVIGPGGVTVRVIDHGIEPPDHDDAWAWLDAEVERREDGEWLRAMIADAARAEPVPAVSHALVDDTGRIWLKHFEPTTDSRLLRGPRFLAGGEWTVVDPDGTVVARVTLPEGFRPLDVAGGRIAGVVTDDLGVQRVAIYSVS